MSLTVKEHIEYQEANRRNVARRARIEQQARKAHHTFSVALGRCQGWESLNETEREAWRQLMETFWPRLECPECGTALTCPAMRGEGT